MPCDTYFLNNRSIPPFDFDFFVNDLSLFPLAHKFILARIIGIELLDIKILDIGDSIGNTPGDVPIMPNDNARRAGETDSSNIDISCYQMTFIPDGGCSLSQVRIITEHRSTSLGHRPIDDPIVTASHHAKATQLLDLLVLFQQIRIDPAIFNSRRD